MNRMENYNQPEEMESFLFSTGTLDGELAIEKSLDPNKLKYHFVLWDGEGDTMVEFDFYEIINPDQIRETYELINQMILGEMKEKYFAISWGRLEIMIMNTENRTIEFIIYMLEREEYDGSDDYLRISISEREVNAFRDFLKNIKIQINKNS